ncbi:MAG: carboxypeptidase-like regulatory domain-containing protein [Bryobacteraceae bacterium]
MQNSKSLAFISGLLLTAALATAADLSGRVTAGRSPLAGAVVTANLVGARRPASVTVTRTGKGGEYVLRGLRNGNYILLVDMGGRRIYQGRVVLTGSTLVKNIELR